MASILFGLSTIGLIIIFFTSHIINVPAAGGEYSEAMIGQPKLINPIFAGLNDVDLDLTALTYSGLFRFNERGELVPDLAKEYTLSDDKKTYDITLKDNLRWSDNEPVTADDIIFSFESILNPEIGSPLLRSFQGVGIEKTGDLSVRFTIKEPFVPFIRTLTFGILPEHVWSNIPASGMKIAAPNLKPVGTGPWKFKSLVKNDNGTVKSYTLEHNSHYVNQLPLLKNLTFRFFSDYPEAIQAFKTKQVDALSFVPNALRDKVAGNNVNLFSLTLPQYTALFFNQTQNTFLKNTDVRRALAQAIDRTSIAETTLGGSAIPLDSPFPPTVLELSPDAKHITTDLPGSKRLLDSAGWTEINPEQFFDLQKNSLQKTHQKEIDALRKTNTPSSSAEIATIMQGIETEARSALDKNQTTYRRDKNNNVLRITITTVDSPEYKTVADAVATAWRTLGIITNVTVISPHQINREAIKTRSYEVLLYGEIVGSDPDIFPFWHSSQIASGLNLAGFSDRDADKLLETARQTLDPKKRAELYEKFQNLLIASAPATVLFAPTYTFATWNRVQGITTGIIFSPPDRFATLNNWYVNTTWNWK